MDGDNKNGESSKARKAAFNTDFTFNIAEYFHFCNRLLKKEPMKGEKGAPCMIVFCAFQQIPQVITEAEKYGFKNYIPLTFCKNYSPQVLKANMKIVGATEYALVLYRGKLPKFNNASEDGKTHMIFNWFDWKRDGKDYPKIHPSQKPAVRAETPDRDLYRSRRCGHRPLRRQRCNAPGCQRTGTRQLRI